jgi:hypothetical protein
MSEAVEVTDGTRGGCCVGGCPVTSSRSTEPSIITSSIHYIQHSASHKIAKSSRIFLVYVSRSLTVDFLADLL